MHLTSGDGWPDGRQGLATAGELALAGTPRTSRADESPRSAAWRRPWLLWGGGLLLAGAALFVLYLRQSMLVPFNADGASVMLQAQSMLHGNVLLRGWWLADVTFYTTELPEYMLVELFRGLRPDVVHIAGALTYTLIVLLGALLARGRAKGTAGIARALLAAGIMLAPGIMSGTPVLLENPDHVGTAVPILAVLLILDRAAQRWYVPVAVCVLLAWTQVADQLTLVAAIVPVAAVAVVRLFMLAAARRPLAEYRYDALLLAAAGLSIELAKAAEWAVRHLGGYVTHPLPQRLLAPSSQVPGNARVMGQTIMLLFGADYPGPHQDLEIIGWFHLIGLGLAGAGAGFAVAIATFASRRTDRVSQILVAGTLAMLAAGILGTELPALSHAHEVAILLPFGAVLAGRTLPGPLPERWRPRRVVLPVFAAWLGCGLAALGYAASWPPRPPDQALANWLTGHGYTDGLSTYWQANSTIVATGGKVLVAPITATANAARHWESSVSWYNPGHRLANFVIALADPAAGTRFELTTAAVQASFGRPDRQYVVGPYVIMVYDYNLLTRLHARHFPGTTPPGG